MSVIVGRNQQKLSKKKGFSEKMKNLLKRNMNGRLMIASG